MLPQTNKENRAAGQLEGKMSKPKKITKKDSLQLLITDFAVSIMGSNAITKEKWNKAWRKMWCEISKLEIV